MLNQNPTLEDKIVAALKAQNPQKARELLSNKRVDSQYSTKFRTNDSLYIALRYGYNEIVNFLFKVRCINPDLDSTYLNLLMLATEKGHTEVVELLLKEGRFDSNSLANAATRAIENGCVEILNLLLSDSRYEPTNLVMLVAACCEHIEVMKLLLSSAKYDPTDDRIIIIPAQSGQTEIVKLLLADSRVDPSVSNDRAIQLASEGGHAGVVKLLLADPRVNPAANHNYAIWNAALRSHMNVVRLLLADPRIDLQIRDEVMLDAINAGNTRMAVEVAFNRFGVFSHIDEKRAAADAIPPETTNLIIKTAVGLVKRNK